MKHKTSLLALLAAAALAVGCNKPATPSEQLGTVPGKPVAATQDLNHYTFAQKTEYTAKMQSQLAEIERDLQQLAAKIDKASATAKAEAQPKLQVLRDKAARLNQQLDEVKNATESTWDTVKAGSLQAYDDLKDGFTQARQWVSDKIAP